MPSAVEEEALRNAGQRETGMAQAQWKVGTEVGVNEKDDSDGRNDVTDCSPGHLEGEEDDEPAQDGIDGPGLAPHPVCQFRKFDNVIDDESGHAENEEMSRTLILS